MKIAIVGASGKIGSRISAEAISRGHSVTGIARNPEAGIKNENIKWIKADALNSDSLASAIQGHDALISAFGIDWSRPETYPLFVDVSKSEIAAAKESRRKAHNCGGRSRQPGSSTGNTISGYPTIPGGMESGCE